jgi:hypothetical protein
MSRRSLGILIALAALGAVFLLGGPFVVETFVSDAATRLAYQIRDEAAALRKSGEATRTFQHRPRSWPEGISGDYRIEITETRTSPGPGHRSIGVARSLTAPTWYATSYHLNFVEVPKDVAVAHRRGEATTVTLRLENGKVLLSGLE